MVFENEVSTLRNYLIWQFPKKLKIGNCEDVRQRGLITKPSIWQTALGQKIKDYQPIYV